MSDPAARRLLWYLFAGSKGGENRIKIINLLQDTPLNINRMAEVLNLDYKAVQHHVDVLQKNNLVSRMGEKYGIMYFVSNYLESNMDTFKEIVNKINKSKSI
ncbi:MAG: winged helix-turn-helix transcriptional regulator [Thaumarchaeota archaeon]|jgi:predicted transcriptional regulator|nr:MAG: winged helix-turn-helix transcriptional regulator [Nitrososphaerota archaeon]HVD07024.1 winged helix-turn-helix domain-containing protein [Nitrososphaeraceae archaeon]